MSAYIIEGGHPLDGSVRIHGAKNSVLPILAACLLAPGECVIHNCPELSDVAASLDILRHLGCRAERQGDAVVVDASAPTGWDVPDALMREMRSSVIFLGAILGRMGRALSLIHIWTTGRCWTPSRAAAWRTTRRWMCGSISTTCPW